MPENAFVSAFRSGGGASATLTITFGEGVQNSGDFYLIINNTQYVITFGNFDDAPNVAIWRDNDGAVELQTANNIALLFDQYIQATFSSSLTVSRTSNVVTLTTVAASGASLSATCFLPIFPNVPL